MASGVVILKREGDISSFGAVRRVQRIFGAKKAGHTGTLDPMAEGVLPVLIDGAVKASEFMLTADKHYTATLRLGITTDTEDIWGEVLSKSDALPTEFEVMAAIDSFVGVIRQTPPMYSALKVGGRKLCDLAREGAVIDREAREITVFSIDAERISESDYSLKVHCSKGTYIRTLCADIGRALGCGGVMASLLRTEASGFTLDMAHTLGELESMSPDERLSALVPTEEIFARLSEVRLPPFFAKLAKSGLEIYVKKIGVNAEILQRFRMKDEHGRFFAVGEAREYEDGIAIKPIRQFID